MPARWTLPHRFGLRYNSPWQGKVLEAQRLKTVTQITDGSHVFSPMQATSCWTLEKKVRMIPMQGVFLLSFCFPMFLNFKVNQFCSDHRFSFEYCIRPDGWLGHPMVGAAHRWGFFDGVFAGIFIRGVPKDMANIPRKWCHLQIAIRKVATKIIGREHAREKDIQHKNCKNEAVLPKYILIRFSGHCC